MHWDPRRHIELPQATHLGGLEPELFLPSKQAQNMEIQNTSTSVPMSRLVNAGAGKAEEGKMLV